MRNIYTCLKSKDQIFPLKYGVTLLYNMMKRQFFSLVGKKITLFLEKLTSLTQEMDLK